MAIALQSKPGISSTTTLNIPKDWDPTWFRNFISNQLKGADVRNAVGANGISITGNISSPYATISIGSGPITISGPLTIGPPASGDTLIVKQFNGSNNIDLWAGSTNGNAIIEAFTTTGSVTLGFLEWIAGTGGVGGATECALTNSGTTANDYVSIVSGSSRRIQINGSGNITMNAPSTGNTLSVSAANGLVNFAGVFISGNAGQALKVVGRSAGTPTIEFDTTTNTGAGTGTLIANKPGGNTNTVAWLPVTYNGNTGYIPIFG